MLLELNGGSNTIACVGIRYVEEIALTFGILTLIAIAVDRYRLIVYPQFYKPTFLRTIFVIIGLLIVSFIYSLNVFVENTFTEIWNILIEDEDSDLWWRVYGFIVHFGLPLIVLIVLYLKIVKKLWRKDEVVSASTLMKRRTVKLTLICSLAYGMCWSPFYIFEIAHDSNAWSDGHDELFLNSRFVTIFIALSGSLINPIIYGCFSQNVMQEIWLIKNNVQCKTNKIDVVNN
ncbi:PROKR2 [Mytilus coruscus]|uniref:PROKR2 n=1 Tax=Mytilus coruscus TaxID=42192 RepID=A0A6J7ZZS1_MYTCO|nr:PROKR2 [Mytilus coruscus]